MMVTPKRYTALRVFAALLKILAWVVLIGSILAAAGIGFGGLSGAGHDLINPRGTSQLAPLLSGIPGVIAALIFGIVYFIALFAAGQSISLQVDVEHNTRETHELLRQILRAQQLPPVEPPAAETVPYRPLPPLE